MTFRAEESLPLLTHLSVQYLAIAMLPSLRRLTVEHEIVAPESLQHPLLRLGTLTKLELNSATKQYDIASLLDALPVIGTALGALTAWTSDAFSRPRLEALAWHCPRLRSFAVHASDLESLSSCEPVASAIHTLTLHHGALRNFACV